MPVPMAIVMVAAYARPPLSWRNLTDAGKVTYDSRLNCWVGINQSTNFKRWFGHSENQGQRLHVPVQEFMGARSNDAGLIRSFLASYDHVHFFGDSVMRQQFATLLCMMDPLNAHNNVPVPEGELEIAYHLNQPLGRQTVFKYTETGSARLFHDAIKALPESSHNATLFVIGGGLRFHPRDTPNKTFAHHALGDDCPELVQFARSVASVAFSAPPALVILWMETTDQQWPTDNGDFHKNCMWFATCAPVTPAREIGMGNSSDVCRHGPNNKLRDKVGVCLPNCLAANWRNMLTNPVFEGSRVQVVPVWQQLVSHGYPHMRKNGDCAHKSLDVLIMMNQQLLRAA